MSQSAHLWGRVPVNSYEGIKVRGWPHADMGSQQAAHTCVSVQMVPEQGDGPESSATQVTLVGSLVSVTLHVAV